MGTLSDDDMGKALADFQSGPKSEPLSDAEHAARVEALRRYLKARGDALAAREGGVTG